MLLRSPNWLPRVLLLAYALAAVLGADLVLCVQPGGHTAYEFGAAECCVGPLDEDACCDDEALDERHGEHAQACADEHGCGACSDLDLLSSHRSPTRCHPAELLAAALPTPPVPVQATAGEWIPRALPPPPSRPPRDPRRGTVLRC